MISRRWSNIDFKATFGKSSVSLAGTLDHNMIDLQASAEIFLGPGTSGIADT